MLQRQMTQHRGQWNRTQWARKTTFPSAVHSVDSPPSPSKPQTVRGSSKEDAWTWGEAGRTETDGACWDSVKYDANFFEENRKIFEWDDSGAEEYRKTSEARKLQGVFSSLSTFEVESDQYLAAIDWDTYWSCNIPECADVLTREENKKKNSKGNFTWREQSGPGCNSPVILGLPGGKDDPVASDCATPSIHLPLFAVPAATGWEEETNALPAASPVISGWEDSPVTPTKVHDMKLDSNAQAWWQSPTIMDATGATAITWPDVPSSYQHIIPSGWDDIQTSGAPDVQMYQGDDGWGADFQSHEEPRNGVSGCDSMYSTAREVYSNSHHERPRDVYNNSYKYGYWKPKRGGESHNYDTNGRRNSQRPGRPISSMYKVNQDFRQTRGSTRWERSKTSAWQSGGTLSHGTKTAPKRFTYQEERASLIKNQGVVRVTSVDV